ncbi:PH domain-containing protein [Dyella sp.]|uniref:PH domain-containing protein n=1 Tax=Dyella sp. TaxID=1869338 RepID=UPI002D7915CD|nr:PH domain-containing protein [Dyella sp.]HET6430875.1 PH domain-containing protein [Dyella sp.]
MTIAPEAMGAPTPSPALQPERRLHPLSWLFVLLAHLKQFIFPILVLLFFGRGDRNDLWSVVVICVLATLSIWRYYTYRFRIGQDSLQIRSGMLERSLREIPFARIQNVALHQTLLHRIFGVAEVRLESAGGIKPEAEMRVLALSDALALEALVRRRRGETVAEAHGATPVGEVLYALTLGDILRLGLISNRGMIVIGGAFAALAQFSTDLISDLLEKWGRAMFGVFEGFFSGFGHGHVASAALVLIVGFELALRVFSIGIALLNYAGFRLEEHGRRLTLERGLFTRLRTSTPRRRIQSWILHEGMLHRWFGRRTLEVSTAVLENGSRHHHPRSLRELAPVATPERCDALIRHLAPQMHWPPAEWKPLHRLAFWRLFLPQLLLACAIGAAAWWRLGKLGLIFVALWVPWIAYIAWQNARHAGYAADDRLVAVRGGWWTREWRFAEIGKLHAIRWGQTPVDRMLGMARLLLDTAGGNAMEKPLQLRFLPEAEARALFERLGRAQARKSLRW